MPTLTLVQGGAFAPSSTMDAAFESFRRDRDDDDLCTPMWLWVVVGTVAPIVLDPCSNPWAYPVAPIKLERDSKPDGLNADWAELVKLELGRRGVVYVNPPYARGHLEPWAWKCATEARTGLEVVMLSPVAPTTAWWRLARRSCDAVAYLDRRIQFEGGDHRQGMIDSAVWYWGAHPGAFLEAFSGIADVRVFDGPREPLPIERPPAPPPRKPKKKKRKPTGRGVARSTPKKPKKKKPTPARPGIAKVRRIK